MSATMGRVLRRFGDQRLRIVFRQVLQGMRRAPGQLTPKSAGTN
jgi:hypothetical protein